MEHSITEKAASLAFTAEEYQERMARVRQIMQQHAVDVLLIDQTEFMAYLTGFSVSENMYRTCVIPANGEPIVIFRAIDIGPFIENSWVSTENAITFSDWEDPVQVLADVITQRGWAKGRVGIDEYSYCMPVKRYRQLTKALPDAEFIDVSEQMQLLRTVKSPTEAGYVRRASQIADQAMSALVEQATGQHISARKAAAIVHQVYMENGGDTSRSGIITTGEGDGFLHGNLHDTALEDGQILHAELLPFYKGYSSRLMRPFIRGQHKEKIEQANRIIEIQDRQLAAMKPGVQASEIDAIARNGIKSAGMRTDFPNITGYTVGYFPLSTPHTSDFSRVFGPHSQWELEAGMTFHMYLSSSGLAFSETVLVTDAGAESLTKSPRKIHIV